MEHAFVGKVFYYDPIKFNKDWSYIAVVGGHGRLCSPSSVKVPSTKHTDILP